jgi:gas vesicle protein
MSKSKIAVGAIIGAVAGIIAGLLTAPKSGKETRADLKAKADELKTETARRAKDLEERSERVVEDARDRFSNKE